MNNFITILGVILFITLLIYTILLVYDRYLMLKQMANLKQQLSEIRNKEYDKITRDLDLIEEDSSVNDLEQFKKDNTISTEKLSMPISFKDGEIAYVKNLSIFETYNGILEGSPTYASKKIWKRLKKTYNEQGKLLLEPTLIPSPFQDGYCLPWHTISLHVESGIRVLDICFFSIDNPFESSLKEFIEKVTSSIDFNTHSVEWDD